MLCISLTVKCTLLREFRAWPTSSSIIPHVRLSSAHSVIMGLWDYDDSDEEQNLPPSQPASQKSPSVISGDDSDFKPSPSPVKRKRGRPARSGVPRKATKQKSEQALAEPEIILLDNSSDDDDDEQKPVPSNSKSRRGKQRNDDQSEQNGAGPSTRPGRTIQDAFKKAAQGKQQQQVHLLDNDDEDDVKADLDPEMKKKLEQSRRIAATYAGLNESQEEPVEVQDSIAAVPHVRRFQAMPLLPTPIPSPLGKSAPRNANGSHETQDLEIPALPEQPAAQSEQVKLVLKHKTGEFAITISKNKPVETLVKAFIKLAQDHGIKVPEKTAAFRVEFDGEKCALDSTVGELEVDDEDNLDISWK